MSANTSTPGASSAVDDDCLLSITTIDTVIIGGGQAGLAMSRCLQDCDRSHVILERERLVERWRSERWDSLRLLTPNWLTRLPGYRYQGNDPDGYMTASETVNFFQEYADSFHAPIKTYTEVLSVERSDDDDDTWKVLTNRGTEYKARNVVIATGFCDQARVPDYAKHIPSNVLQLDPSDYHRPSQMPRGNVLIVGAGATSCQIAQELLDYQYNEKNLEPQFGKIFLSVGRHTRLPRLYRGKDILYWLDAIGFFSVGVEASTERDAPAPQIIGTPRHANLDLAILQSRGVQLVGHASGIMHSAGGEATMTFENDLHDTMSVADAKLIMLLSKIDEYINQNEIEAPPSTRLDSVPIPSHPPTEIDLNDIRTLIWATGYKRNYPFLHKLPSLLDKHGDVRHNRGVTPEKGIYILGMRFEMTRSSNFIDGVGADAQAIANHISMLS